MHVCIFTLRFNPVTEGFDDRAEAGFLADKDVLSIRDHFFDKDDITYLTLVIRYRAAAMRCQGIDCIMSLLIMANPQSYLGTPSRRRSSSSSSSRSSAKAAPARLTPRSCCSLSAFCTRLIA